jgi:zona occludens toxin
VWCFFTDWKGQDGVGPLYIVDECQISFPKQGTGKDVEQWFQLHRHYNADVLLLSQNFRQVDLVIAALLANLIICRKADILGDSSGYIRKVKAGYRGDVIQTDRRKYEQQFFSLYRSHTQSSASAEATASDVSPKYKKLKWITRVYWVFAIAFVAWAFWPQDKPKTPLERSLGASAPAPQAKPATLPASGASAPQTKLEPEPEPETFGVLDGKAVHIVGNMTMGGRTTIVFEVSDGGRRLFQLDSHAIERSGYTLRMTDDCLVELRSPSGKARAVTCDAPIVATRDTRQPLVIDRASGASSWDRNGQRPYQAAAVSGSL